MADLPKEASPLLAEIVRFFLLDEDEPLFISVFLKFAVLLRPSVKDDEHARRQKRTLRELRPTEESWNKALSRYAESSITDLGAWEFLQHQYAGYRMRGAQLPEALQAWVDRLVTGKISKPKGKPGRRADGDRQLRILLVVTFLRAEGMSLENAVGEIHKITGIKEATVLTAYRRARVRTGWKL